MFLVLVFPRVSSGSNHVGVGSAGRDLPVLNLGSVGMASPDWFADPRGGDGLGDVPMLEFLLPPAEDPAEPDPVATTPRLYQEQGEAEPPFPHRSSRRRAVVGKGPHAPHNPLEHLLGVASESRERRGLGDPNKKKMNDENQSWAAEREPATPSELKWSGDMQFIMGPKVSSPPPSPLQSLLGSKVPSPPSSPLRALIKPALDIWNWWANGSEHRPLESKRRRADLPTLPQKGKGRGNKGRALGFINLKVKRRETLERDFQARSAWGPKVSRRKTLESFMAADPQAEGSRLNVESLKNLAAALKEGGYKSAVIYLAEAKLVHVEKGWEWTAQLDRYFKLCKRSLERARGPRKKAPEVPVELRKTPPPKEIVWRLKILFAYELFLVATVWMLREIEVASLKIASFMVNHLEKKVTLILDASKTDPEATGVRRTLQCTCCRKTCEWDCPFKLTLDLVMKVEKIGGTDSPLCIRRNRNQVSKAMLVTAWCMVFKMKLGGHSARRSGALHYVRLGWTLPQIAYLGRWKSNIVVEYAQEALELSPINFKVVKENKSPTVPDLKGAEVWDQIEACQKNLRKEVNAVKVELSKSKVTVEKIANDFEKFSERHGGHLPPWVQSCASKTVHKNITVLSTSPPFTWRTLCGWYYAASSFVFVEKEGDTVCLKCKAAQVPCWL